MNIPAFKYYKDPVKDGTIIQSENTCIVCEQHRRYVFSGDPFNFDEIYQDSICPWCIADGSAHEKFDVAFTDVYGAFNDRLPETVIEEIAFRTPGFHCLQSPYWIDHCGDAAVFLGRAGGNEIKTKHPDLIPQIDEDYRSDGLTIDEYLNELEIDGSLEAYVFQCRHCGHKECYVHAD